MCLECGGVQKCRVHNKNIALEYYDILSNWLGTHLITWPWEGICVNWEDADIFTKIIMYKFVVYRAPYVQFPISVPAINRILNKPLLLIISHYICWLCLSQSKIVSIFCVPALDLNLDSFLDPNFLTLVWLLFADSSYVSSMCLCGWIIWQSASYSIIIFGTCWKSYNASSVCTTPVSIHWTIQDHPLH